MKIFKKAHLLLILVSMIPACSTVGKILNPYEENFRCRAKDETGKCIDTPSAYQEARNAWSLREKPASIQAMEKAVAEKRYKTVGELLSDEKVPILHPPKVVRVLFLPYKGAKEELFMSRYVYLKVKDSSWILTDVEEK